MSGWSGSERVPGEALERPGEALGRPNFGGSGGLGPPTGVQGPLVRAVGLKLRRLRGQILAKFRQIFGFLHLNRDPARPEGALLGQIWPNLALGTPFQGSWGPPSRGPGDPGDPLLGPPKRAFPGPTPGFPVFGGSPGLKLGQNLAPGTPFRAWGPPFPGLGTPFWDPGDPLLGPPKGPNLAKFQPWGPPEKGISWPNPGISRFRGSPGLVPGLPRTPDGGSPGSPGPLDGGSPGLGGGLSRRYEAPQTAPLGSRIYRGLQYVYRGLEGLKV